VKAMGKILVDEDKLLEILRKVEDLVADVAEAKKEP